VVKWIRLLFWKSDLDKFEEYDAVSDKECIYGCDFSSTQKREVVSRIKIVTRLRM
jgi:hypothetical protein